MVKIELTQPFLILGFRFRFELCLALRWPYNIIAKTISRLTIFFRETAIRAFVYFDDILLLHPSSNILSQQNHFVQKQVLSVLAFDQVLLEMGWCTIYRKTNHEQSNISVSSGTPSKTLLKWLPQDRTLKCAALIKYMLNNQCWTW